MSCWLYHSRSISRLFITEKELDFFLQKPHLSDTHLRGECSCVVLFLHFLFKKAHINNSIDNIVVSKELFMKQKDFLGIFILFVVCSNIEIAAKTLKFQRISNGNSFFFIIFHIFMETSSIVA